MMVVSMVAKATPFIPYLGINSIFNPMLNIIVTVITFLKNACLPVIFKNVPTEPEIALTNCQMAIKINANPPALNSSPNKPIIKDGNSNIITKKGMEVQKIIFVV